jgi:hypothetical protein
MYSQYLKQSKYSNNTLINSSGTSAFRARWTNDIHDEWTRSLKEAYPDIGVEKIQRIRGLIDASVPDCLVRGYKRIIDGLELPDANDRHVLAAAIKAGAQVIVTFNKSDFPEEILAEFDIEAQHPDDFILYQKEENLQAVLSQLQQCRIRLQRPPCTMENFIEKFRRNELLLTAEWLTDLRGQFE